jgi:RecG-like helicase
MGMFRRFFHRIAESDEQRLAEEIVAWAQKVPGTVRIAEAPTRQRVKIAGVIKRMTVFPMAGKESLEVLVSDGTGEVTAEFMGRRAISGLSLGTRVVIEGVIGEQRGSVRMMNPRLEFSA